MVYQSPTMAIERLIKDGFFRDGKTDLDVVDTLKIKGFKHPRASVAATLLRFVRKEALRREKTNSAYTYFSSN